MKILIVDDQAIHRDLLEAIFAKWPEHQITSVGSGQEALTLLKSRGHRYDLVFLDINMPDVSGLEVLEQIRESPLHRSLQIVMCTCYKDRSTVLKAIELGARHYIVKPATEEGITQKLRQVGAIPDYQQTN